MAIANYARAGAWTESLGIIAPLQEVMLQSWDGALCMFPTWPRALEARFDDFRAEGAFLVSAAWANGRVQSLAIHSERGARCRLYPPWPGGVKVVNEAGEVVDCVAGECGRVGFTTQPEGKYRLTPREF